jgi:hypothetical protein
MNNERGSAIIVVIVLAAIITELIFLSMSRTASHSQMTYMYRLMAAKDKTQLMLRNYSRMPISIRNGLADPTNTVLKGCVQSGSCPVAPVEFTLYSPLQGAMPIAGTSTNPVYYDQFGKICAFADTTLCPLRAFSSFQAIASNIVVSFLVDTNPAAKYRWQVLNVTGTGTVAIADIALTSPLP